MDTLFRLVSLQSSDQQSFNSTTTTTTTNSSNSTNHLYHHHHHHNHHFPQDQVEECFNFFMDEEDFSSSSSKPPPPQPPPHHYYYDQPPPHHHHHQSYISTTTTTTPTSSSTPPSQYSHSHSYHATAATTTTPPENFSFSPVGSLNLDFSGGNNWSSELLLETARAIADKNSARVQQLMWMLNELSSPYGDTDQKVAAYFLQALFSRMTDSGHRCYATLASASDKSSSFESTRKTILKFQEVSPWTTFGHVAANAAILEAFDGESNLHIVDLSNTFCTQWPTLLEALATRADDTPTLRLTTVVSSAGAGAGKVMKEIGARMEKFARLMGVPFKFAAVHHSGDLSELSLADLEIRDDEALAVNLVGALHSVSPAGGRRDALISAFRSLNPKLITVVEEEADLNSGDDGAEFVRGFEEALRWFRVYFDSLDESFPKTSNERLALERTAGRAVVDLVARPAAESVERREEAARWARRFCVGGFKTVTYSEEVCDDVRALLRRYREGWAMTQCSDAGIFLTWKDTPVVWASAWRPA